jgi:7-keto-8-aminopelargonate synthetase-like enzyme
VPVRSGDEVAALSGVLIIRTGTTREVSQPPSSFHVETALRCRRSENRERHDVRRRRARARRLSSTNLHSPNSSPMMPALLTAATAIWS